MTLSDLDEIRHEAYQEGYEDGYSRGYDDGYYQRSEDVYEFRAHFGHNPPIESRADEW